MVKLMFLCRRRADISHADYVQLLLEGHVPLAITHHPRMRQYVVNVVEESAPDAPQLDSIGALYFDSLADFRERLYDSAEGKRVIGDDVQRFMGGAHAYATTEHIQLSNAPPAARGVRSAGVKIICPLRRRAGMTHAEFVDHWLTRHVPLAVHHCIALTSYVTNVVDEHLSDQAPELDGIAELRFVGDGWPRQLYASPEGARAMDADRACFIDNAVTYRVGEYVQKLPGD